MRLRADSIIHIEGRTIAIDAPSYLIADIAANHDGDLERAKDLIHLAAECGADAAKFQHFSAPTIVSDTGFRKLGGKLSHQSGWKKSVFEVYQSASLNLDWTQPLKEACDKAGIHFFTSPYAMEIVDAVDPYVAVYKIGSGDINWLAIQRHIAGKGKPVLLAAGASSCDEVAAAVENILPVNPRLVLMQCNTNYTGSVENFRYIQLNVLKSFQVMFPGMIVGLSDHTPGSATVLGAVALGARVIEKHFTDDTGREGPDHGFSMGPKAWREMVDRVRELEAALGDGVKRIEANERETVFVQRRAIRARKNLEAGRRLEAGDVTVLRPCPADGLPPYEMDDILGREIVGGIDEGDLIRWRDLT